MVTHRYSGSSLNQRRVYSVVRLLLQHLDSQQPRHSHSVSSVVHCNLIFRFQLFFKLNLMPYVQEVLVQIRALQFLDLSNPPLVLLVLYSVPKVPVRILQEQDSLVQADQPLSGLTLVSELLERPLIREVCLVKLNNLRLSLHPYSDRVAQPVVVSSVPLQVGLLVKYSCFFIELHS